jgi:hypothetical protein
VQRSSGADEVVVCWVARRRSAGCPLVAAAVARPGSVPSSPQLAPACAHTTDRTLACAADGVLDRLCGHALVPRPRTLRLLLRQVLTRHRHLVGAPAGVPAGAPRMRGCQRVGGWVQGRGGAQHSRRVGERSRASRPLQNLALSPAVLTPNPAVPPPAPPPGPSAASLRRSCWASRSSRGATWCTSWNSSPTCWARPRPRSSPRCVRVGVFEFVFLGRGGRGRNGTSVAQAGGQLAASCSPRAGWAAGTRARPWIAVAAVSWCLLPGPSTSGPSTTLLLTRCLRRCGTKRRAAS